MFFWSVDAKVSKRSNKLFKKPAMKLSQFTFIARAEVGMAYDSGKGALYVSTTSGLSIVPDSSSSSPTSSPSATSTATSSPTPTVPEFSSAALVSLVAAMAAVTLSAVVIGRKKSKQLQK